MSTKRSTNSVPTIVKARDQQLHADSSLSLSPVHYCKKPTVINSNASRQQQRTRAPPQSMEKYKISKKRKKSESLSKNEENSKRASNFILNFTHLVSTHFKCPICQSILEEPVILECNHLFCEVCIQEWIQVLQTKSDIKSCPVCRKLIRNLVHVSDLPSSTLGSFLSKFGAINHCFKNLQKSHSNLKDSFQELLSSTLDIPYSFKNIETIHNLNELSLHCQTSSRARHFLHLLAQIQDSDNELLKSRAKSPKTWWDRFQGNCLNTFRMLCPAYLQELQELVSDYFSLVSRRHRQALQGQWEWSRPKPILYIWIGLTLFYFYFIYHFGTILLANMGLRKSFKRLLQHAIFICLDIPTFELINIIREAFLTPL